VKNHLRRRADGRSAKIEPKPRQIDTHRHRQFQPLILVPQDQRRLAALVGAQRAGSTPAISPPLGGCSGTKLCGISDLLTLSAHRVTHSLGPRFFARSNARACVTPNRPP
jgi:hypothetical protein